MPEDKLRERIIPCSWNPLLSEQEDIAKAMNATDTSEQEVVTAIESRPKNFRVAEKCPSTRILISVVKGSVQIITVFESCEIFFYSNLFTGVVHSNCFELGLQV